MLVHFGCGTKVGPSWLNFDNSPTLRLQRLPVVGRLTTSIFGAVKFPAEVRYGDICSGLPLPDNSVHAVFSSHVLEHLSFDDFRVALRNTHRMMADGGVFRLVVPDLFERAALYVDGARAGDSKAGEVFLRSTRLGRTRRPTGPIGRLRATFGGSEHLWMWDQPAMTEALAQAGFVNIRRCVIGDSDVAAFAELEEPGRFVDEPSGIAELALEARKA